MDGIWGTSWDKTNSSEINCNNEMPRIDFRIKIERDSETKINLRFSRIFFRGVYLQIPIDTFPKRSCTPMSQVT